MKEFVVHTVPGSPYARAVLIALEEKAIPYRVAAVVPGTLKASEHLRLHPFGRVPVVEHGDFRLYETQAILRYIDRMKPEPALTPASAEAAARMDQVMNINDWYLFQGVANIIVFQRVIGPRLMGLIPDEQAIAAAMPRARVVFDELAHQLSDRTWFAGDRLSLADILVAPQLDFFSEATEWQSLAGGHPNLLHWLERMRARPSVKATTRDRVVERIRAA